MNGLVFGQSTSCSQDAHSQDAAPNHPQVTCRLARGVEDMLQVYAVRAIVFVNDQQCPFSEEFDGNDFNATHVIAYYGAEPVATMRIRFFADFVKFERVAVRKEYRKHQVAVYMVRYAMDLCSQKGYRKIYGHIEKRLMRFWKYFGFVERPDSGERERVVFSDRAYCEAICDLAPHPDTVTMDSSPFVLNRPEGDWNKPGVLDYSSVREAINA